MQSNGLIIEVACWAHTRRYFEQALQNHSKVSGPVLEWVRQLYDIEDRALLMSDGERLSLRQSESVPILRRMGAWLKVDDYGLPLKKALPDGVLPKSSTGKAVRYLLNNSCDSSTSMGVSSELPQQAPARATDFVMRDDENGRLTQVGPAQSGSPEQPPRSELPATLPRVTPTVRAVHFSPASRHSFSPPFSGKKHFNVDDAFVRLTDRHCQTYCRSSMLATVSSSFSERRTSSKRSRRSCGVSRFLSAP